MIVLDLTPEQLDEKIQKAVSTALQSLPQNAPDRLLTRKQAAELLDISLPTLTAWEKAKRIKATRIGSRVYFKQSELIR